MTKIPLPGSNPAEPFQKGVESGTQLWQQLLGQGRQQGALNQQWQEHMRNAAIREQQEARLAEQQPLNMDLLRKKIEAEQAKSENNPLNKELLKAKIESEKQKAEKYKKGDSQKETPEEKDARALKLWEEKEDRKAYKKQELDRTTITEPVRTQNQKVLISIDTVDPLLDALIKEEVPGNLEFSPNQQAIADSLANLAADDLMTIFSLPKDQHSSKMVEQMVKRQRFEGIDSYRKRLKQLKARIDHRRTASTNVLSTGKVDLNKSHGESPQEVSEKNKAAHDPFGIL